jgi:hypothetical protein
VVVDVTTASADEVADVLVAVGCEEGRHRSVAVVDQLVRQLAKLKFQVVHRDLERRKLQIREQKKSDTQRRTKYGQNDEDFD